MEEKSENRKEEINNLEATFAKRIRNNFMDVLGLAILVAFTLIIILIALLSQGALIYYYEPNKVIWMVEVVLGFCAVMIGIKRIKEPWREALMLRSLRKSRVRTEIIMYLYTIYPEASYPTDIARGTGIDATNVLGGLRGMGNGFAAKSKSLLKIGLVDRVERDGGICYQLSKQAKSLIENLGMSTIKNPQSQAPNKALSGLAAMWAEPTETNSKS